jgi:hypothetical protein
MPFILEYAITGVNLPEFISFLSVAIGFGYIVSAGMVKRQKWQQQQRSTIR